MVVAAPGQELPALPSDVRIVRDPVSGRGPLQGLAAGLAALPETAELVFATGTDVPFLEPAWVETLVALMVEHDLAIPDVDGRHHPLAALYRRATVLPAIGGLLAEDRLRPVYLMDKVRTRVVDVTELLRDRPGIANLAEFEHARGLPRGAGGSGLRSGGKLRISRGRFGFVLGFVFATALGLDRGKVPHLSLFLAPRALMFNGEAFEGLAILSHSVSAGLRDRNRRRERVQPPTIAVQAIHFRAERASPAGGTDHVACLGGSWPRNQA